MKIVFGKLAMALVYFWKNNKLIGGRVLEKKCHTKHTLGELDKRVVDYCLQQSTWLLDKMQT